MSDLFCKQTIDCNQGSVRAVRYNGDEINILKTENIVSISNIKINIF